MPIIDIFGGEFSRRGQCRGGVFDTVMALEAAFQPFENFNRLRNRRLGHVDFLETTRERVIFFEDATIFAVGSRADAFQLPG